MNDYDLERLNTRSFEQLVQALAVAVLGRHVAVFGDGADGGREATFQGMVDYPHRDAPWEGYGIVQAKFRQQPSGVQRQNADWALRELKSEFGKFKPKAKRRGRTAPSINDRVCPDYYIFATNLTLTPVLHAGGKDRVTTFLEACKQSHGLIGYAVWDGDQIRRMLDAQTAIRTSFMPFVLPGDVLAIVMQSLQPKQKNFAAIMSRHLQLELLDDQFARLSQGGYTNANRISLSTVFVDLPVKSSAETRASLHPANAPTHPATFLQGLFADAACVLRPSLRPRMTTSGGDQPRQPVLGRCVVIGGPGQGKTTVGVFACQLMRAALLREARHTYDPDVEQALAVIASQSQTLPTLKTLRYPLRVDLKRLAAALAEPGPQRSNSLLHYLTRHISARTEDRVDIEDFRLWLRTYPWLLVLDGLDEVPASSNRTLMMNAVNDFIRVEAHQEDADLMVVATTRPQGYSDDFDPSNYAHLQLLPLRPSEAVQYGERLALARHPGAAPHVSELVRKLSLATKNPATARLMESPLQVTIMLSLIELGGHPPEQRWQLFDQYYETIYKREKERDTPFSAVLREFEPDIHWIHHRAGWLLQQRNAETGKTAARLSHEEFDSLVHKRLVRRGHPNDGDLASLVQQMREAATDRLVLLVGNTANEIGFEIRSLQEFMAAEHAFDGDDEIVRATLNAIASHAYWRNVFLFMAGRVFFKKESLVDTVLAICSRLNEPLEDAALARTLAGSRLALSLLDDDACRKQPANTRQLARLVARLIDFPIEDDRAKLLGLFKREAGEVLKQELLSRLQGSPYNPSAWELCLDLCRDGVDWAKDVVKQRFPWRPVEADQVLQNYEVTGEKLGDFLWGEIARNLRYISLRLAYKLSDVVRPSGTGQLGKHIDPTIATAIEDLVGSHATTGPVLLNEDGKETRNRLIVRTNVAKYRELRLLGTDLSDAHPDWKVLGAAAAFGAEQTIQCLCRHLPHVLAEDHRLLTRFSLPWQFNVCIDAANSGMTAEVIVERVQQGHLGQPSDWARWRNLKRCPISLLVHSPDLFSVNDHALAGLFLYSGWSHGSADVDDEINFLEGLGNCLHLMNQNSKLSIRLIQLACFGLQNQNSKNLPAKWYAIVECFINTAQRQGHGVGIELTAAILVSHLPIDSKLALLQQITSIAPKHYWIHGSRSALSAAWGDMHKTASEVGKERAVLTALGQLPPMQSMESVSSDVLKAMSTGTEVEQHTSNLIKLASRCWDTFEVEDIAREVSSLAENHDKWLSDWCEFIDTAGHHGAKLEELLVVLADAVAAKQDHAFRRRWLRLLAKVVERRPAPIAIPSPLLHH